MQKHSHGAWAKVEACGKKSWHGTLRFGSLVMACALGRSGIVRRKREGDGGTPQGLWPLREVRYRADRVRLPPLRMPTRPIMPTDGWCDAPTDPRYNCPVRLPHAASVESLWRVDGLYDVVVPLGYNDEPVVPGAGSAIFLHVASPGLGPTEGCVALALDDLVGLLACPAPPLALAIGDVQ